MKGPRGTSSSSTSNTRVIGDGGTTVGNAWSGISHFFWEQVPDHVVKAQGRR